MDAITRVFFWVMDLRRFRYVLLADFVVFTSTAFVDFWLAEGEQAVTSLLRLAIGFINLAAWVEIRRHLLSKPQSYRQAWQFRPWEFESAVAGQASAIPVLLAPFWIEFSGNFHDPVDVGVLIIAGYLLFYAAAVSMGAIVSHKSSLGVMWGVVVALLPFVGITQFWYAAIYKPTHERPRVNTVGEMELVRRHDGLSEMLGTVAVENVGEAEIDVLGAVYTVTVHDMGPSDRTLSDARVREALEKHRATWDDESKFRGLIKTGRLIRNGGHLTPGQKFKTSFAFDVKNRPAKKLRLTVFLALANNVGDLKKFTECCPKPNNSYSCFQTKLGSPTIIRHVLGDGPTARISFFPPSKGVHVPYLRTDFLPLDWNETIRDDPRPGVNAIDPFRTSRGVTSSFEYRLDP
ncbi:hypothetical protein ABZY05_36475 [Streptomyces canus]|uniref:hypothetical protein n=1 Tax=Streptomyces canus TaxID=58343 RepID=UPI0033BA3215